MADSPNGGPEGLSYPVTPGLSRAALSKSRAPPGTAYRDMTPAELDVYAQDCYVDMIESSKKDSEVRQANAQALNADLKEQSLIRLQSHQKMMAMIEQRRHELKQQPQTPCKGKVPLVVDHNATHSLGDQKKFSEYCRKI